MGMAFNRTTWKEIVKCAEHFCSYDDYNWDWSLQHVSQHCLKQKLHVMVVKGPRVFHIGEWWVGKICKVQKKIVRRFMRKSTLNVTIIGVFSCNFLFAKILFNKKEYGTSYTVVRIINSRMIVKWKFLLKSKLLFSLMLIKYEKNSLRMGLFYTCNTFEYIHIFGFNYLGIGRFSQYI